MVAFHTALGDPQTLTSPEKAQAQNNLGLVIGTDVQAFSTHLSAVAGLSKTDGGFIVTDGTTFVVESGAIARASLGLGTAAVAAIGTSGDTVPKNNTANSFSADQGIAKDSPIFTLDKQASGQFSLLVGRNAGAARWGVFLGDGGAESGGNAGSNFEVANYSDAGAQLGSPLIINRATGVVTMASGVAGGSYTVASLPTPGVVGRMVWASDCRVFNGAGVQEGAAAGTGGLVTDNGTAWKIAGTNVTAVA